MIIQVLVFLSLAVEDIAQDAQDGYRARCPRFVCFVFVYLQARDSVEFCLVSLMRLNDRLCYRVLVPCRLRSCPRRPRWLPSQMLANTLRFLRLFKHKILSKFVSCRLCDEIIIQVLNCLSCVGSDFPQDTQDVYRPICPQILFRFLCSANTRLCPILSRFVCVTK